MKHNASLVSIYFCGLLLTGCFQENCNNNPVRDMNDSDRSEVRHDFYIKSCQASYEGDYGRSISLLDSALMYSTPEDTSCRMLTILLYKQRNLLYNADTLSAIKVLNQIDKLGFSGIADQHLCQIYISQKQYRKALQYASNDAYGYPDKAIIYDGMQNVGQAIENALLYLETRGDEKFYEGSFECHDLYNILIKNCDLSVSRLEECLMENPKNYQIRQVLMKMYLFELKDYDKVIEYGDWFRDEFQDYSDFDFGYNYWRQEALERKKTVE